MSIHQPNIAKVKEDPPMSPISQVKNEAPFISFSSEGVVYKERERKHGRKIEL